MLGKNYDLDAIIKQLFHLDLSVPRRTRTRVRDIVAGVASRYAWQVLICKYYSYF